MSLNYANLDGQLIHPVLNPADAAPDERLWKVRCDDRGDLCVYVWRWSSADAGEMAEEHAEREGWEVDPDDVVASTVDADEYAAVLAASLADENPTSEAEGERGDR